MAEEISTMNIEKIIKFLDGVGVLDIAQKQISKKLDSFKIMMSDRVEDENIKELVGKAIDKINLASPETLINAKKIFDASLKIPNLDLILSGLNLCATCAGFVIIYSKLDKMSNQINQVMSLIRKSNDVQADYEFKKVLSEHANMLDSRKTKKYYTEEQMRKLVDDEFNVLNMLIDVYTKDLSDDNETLVFSIYSLASMLSVTLRYFDAVYYFNNKEVLGGGDVWHSSHDNWLSVFDKINSDDFAKKIQDHGILDLSLSTVEVDEYYMNMYYQAKEYATVVKEYQTIIQAVDSPEKLAEYEKYIDQEAGEIIHTAFKETDGALDDEEISKAYKDTMKQLALD